jgi:predicted lipoprotein with Yx(FWY)xxD motif
MAATRALISTTHNAKLGTILVSGKTVYTLKPSKVPCTAQCLKIWPEVLLPKGVTTTTAGHGVNASRLGTVSGSGGSLQVTYGGKPLYYFFKDTRPGEVNGNLTDKWGKWSVVVTVKPAHPSTSSVGSSAGSGGVSF